MDNILVKQNLSQFDCKPAPIFRRFAALIYDGFVLFSLLLLATAVALIFNKGESFLNVQYFFLLYLFLVVGLFLSWFWQKSGQTVGLLSWKIRLTQDNLQPITWKRAFLRYVLSYPSVWLGGIGLLWCFIDKENQSLHDRLSGTKMVYIKA